MQFPPPVASLPLTVNASGEDARPAAPGRGGAWLLVSVSARQGSEERLQQAEAALRKHGLHPAVSRTVEPRDLRRALREAVTAGAPLVVIAGGDGTLSLAATELAGTSTALGVLPSGTANDFARSLGIPDDLDAAAALIAAGHLREVDVGLADGRPFLNAASVGLGVAVTRRLSQRLKRWAGKLAYPVAAGREALSTRPFRVRLQVDGERRAVRVFQLVVGNGRYHGAGTLVAPDARPDDGKLHVYAILAAPRPQQDGATRLGRRWRWLARLARATLSLRGRRPRDPREVLTLSAPRRPGGGGATATDERGRRDVGMHAGALHRLAPGPAGPRPLTPRHAPPSSARAPFLLCVDACRALAWARPMSHVPRRLPLVCLALGLLAGCPRTVFNDVPTMGETTCKVKVGDQRSLVLLRCGPPCGGGQVEGGLTCDVYGHAELCYREGRVADPAQARTATGALRLVSVGRRRRTKTAGPVVPGSTGRGLRKLDARWPKLPAAARPQGSSPRLSTWAVKFTSGITRW